VTPARRRNWRPATEIGLLALLAYVPLLLSARGKVAADTKLYLYLNPGRLISDAPWTWDTRQFGGWVPHQVVGYLWPAGPWFGAADAVGVPDWIAQRLWMGTLLFLAGTGVRWAARQLGFGRGSTVFVPIVAALVYQLSPYVLPYISRTSVLLAPWAGLGWLVGLTVLSARRGGWRHAALFALIIASIGGSNGTALVMIAPAPILYLLDAAVRREIGWRRAAAVAARIGGLSAAVSVWWLAGVSLQHKYGADVLAYSETVQSTSYTSSAPEVLRGLGYWLFYVRDAAVATTSASGDYQTSTALITWGWLLIVGGFAGIALMRWRTRSFLALCLLAGVVLAVGVHPIDDPSPLMQPFADRPRSSLVLALRSSSRAVPVSLFALALGIAVGAGWVAGRWRRWGPAVPALVVILAGLNVPALWSRDYVDRSQLHAQEVPDAWKHAAAALDNDADGGRVLLLPGVESAAYRWGYLVDAALPGISDRDLITRDWLPLGSAPVMDLLYALDDRFQDGTIEAGSIAPVARLLGADTVMVANDTAFERFRTVRPEQAWNVYAAGAPGLGTPIGYGEPAVNTPSVPMVDDAALTVPGVGDALYPVVLIPVEDPPTGGRAAAGALLLIAGSGDGVIDAAAAGLIDGLQIVGYSAGLDDDALGDQLADGAALVVTDSNRDRAHHWRTSQDVTGFTEGPGTAVDADDPYDQRLPVFPDQAGGEHTLAEQRGPVTATATSYGEPNAYRPEVRPAMAIDGDPTTAWVTADRGKAIGEAIELTADPPTSSITLTQPDDPAAIRWITRVRITADDAEPVEVDLDPLARTSGQRIDLSAQATRVRVEIVATNLPDSGFYPFENAVGFSEVDLGLGPTEEVVTLPSRALEHTTSTTPLDIVLTRLRTDPAHRWRDDPERQLSRAFDLTDPLSAAIDVTARLSPRAADSVLAALSGQTGVPTVDRRVSGRPVSTGRQALDGDPTTAWLTPFEHPTPSTLTIPLGGTRTVDHLTLTTLVGADYAQPATIDVSAGGMTQTVTAAAPGPDGSRELRFPALTGDTLTITIRDTDGATTTDRRTWEPTLLPVGIAEVGIEGVAPLSPPETIDTGCRADLLTLDGEPLPVRITGSWGALVAGEPVQAELCDGADVSLAAGEHVVRSEPGTATGIDIDRVVLHAGGDAPTQTPVAVTTSRGRASRSFDVAPCPDGCWLVQGEGWNPGWKATVGGESLGRPIALDGGMNAWWLPPADDARTVSVRWTPQRTMWIALAVSALGVLACIVLACLPLPRRRRRPRAAPRGAHGPDPASVTEPVLAPGEVVPALAVDPRPDAVTLAVWSAVVLVVGVLVAGPAWGVLCAALTAAGMWLGRRWIPAAAAVALIAGCGLYIVLHEQRGKFGAGFGWVGEFSRAHRPALAAVVLLVSNIVAAEWARRGPSRWAEEDQPAP
jgi:arabinofuranan 3-O-arabinosyltransferase